MGVGTGAPLGQEEGEKHASLKAGSTWRRCRNAKGMPA